MRGIIVAIMAGIAIMAGTATATASPVLVTEPEASLVNKCDDGLPVWRDSVTGILYGDQDTNGVLAGTDCEWQ